MNNDKKFTNEKIKLMRILKKLIIDNNNNETGIPTSSPHRIFLLATIMIFEPMSVCASIIKSIFRI